MKNLTLRILIIIFPGLLHNCTGVLAQPIDTLLLDFTFVNDITPLEDGTFILIGTKRGAVKVSRINVKMEKLWTQTLTDSLFFQIRDFEIHLEESDSTIQIITVKTTCDIIPPGIASLFTIDFNGNIKDTVFIPFESGREPLFLLSGNDFWPRVALTSGTRIILKYANGDSIILDEHPDILVPRLIDMAPSGKIIVHYQLGSLRIYSPSNGEYIITSGGFVSPDTRGMIYIEDNYIVLLHENYISAIDSNGYEYNDFQRLNSHFFDIKLKNGHFYTLGLDFLHNADTFYVIDKSLNKVYSESVDYAKHISNIAINNNFIYRVGDDGNYPYPTSFIESENLENHEGPKYYDIELISAKLGVPDSLSYFKMCGRYYMYHFPSITITIKNNSDFPVSKATVGYESNSGHCCIYAIWNREISEMNLLPGETKDYVVPEFYTPRQYPFYGPPAFCIYLSAPDNHADDLYLNNEACITNFITNTEDSLEFSGINFYPNPTSDRIRFMTPIDQEVKIKIVDLSGRMIVSQYLNPSEEDLDVEHLIPGVYFIQFITLLGKSDTKKFIKL